MKDLQAERKIRRFDRFCCFSCLKSRNVNPPPPRKAPISPQVIVMEFCWGWRQTQRKYNVWRKKNGNQKKKTVNVLRGIAFCILTGMMSLRDMTQVTRRRCRPFQTPLSFPLQSGQCGR
ncbi:hypothetical protein CAOG_009661 [Capsaspora owczarzaki ATCC 30864]|uniref:Uncharacterized protein n=1 Tax=Capsaspora owczarzaki (strain ATCC 30864) TaxID=595528 RepID=A0A0D2UBN5_CAPO3|nr:hypothetical protein CAOG_009661 [Capsaspora owczarzaki ATCC 30864]